MTASLTLTSDKACTAVFSAESLSVSLGSGKCTQNNDFWEGSSWTVPMSGTAVGGVGASVSVSASISIHKAAGDVCGYGVTGMTSCGQWTRNSDGWCTRTSSSQPQSTSWTAENYTGYPGLPYCPWWIDVPGPIISVTARAQAAVGQGTQYVLSPATTTSCPCVSPPWYAGLCQ
jgi:hypothetical protein